MIELRNVSKHYRSAGEGKPKAVNNVSFTLQKGEILSVIGESGSGKTTIGNMVLKLTNPTEGEILFAGQDITKIRGRTKLKAFYREVQGVFQDPFSTFNPIFNGRQGLRNHPGGILSADREGGMERARQRKTQKCRIERPGDTQ